MSLEPQEIADLVRDAAATGTDLATLIDPAG
jgi:hypothetical protein